MWEHAPYLGCRRAMDKRQWTRDLKFFPTFQLSTFNILLRRNRHQLQLGEPLGREHDVGRIDCFIGGDEVTVTCFVADS